MTRHPRGYATDDFQDVWARYLPHPRATSATSATLLASPVADVADVALTGGGNGQHTLDLLKQAFGPDVVDVDPDDYARTQNPGALGDYKPEW